MIYPLIVGNRYRWLRYPWLSLRLLVARIGWDLQRLARFSNEGPRP